MYCGNFGYKRMKTDKILSDINSLFTHLYQANRSICMCIKNRLDKNHEDNMDSRERIIKSFPFFCKIYELLKLDIQNLFLL